MKKRFIMLVFSLALLSLCAFACAEDISKTPKAGEYVINEMDCTYNNDGKTVFNNMGTVYNNGGTVFNNGGVVYNNGGITYNNGGTVYVNDGEVFNNCGEIYVNGDKGIVHDFGIETALSTKTDLREAGEKPRGLPGYEITLAGDYGDFASIYGFVERDGKLYIAPDGEAVISVKPGVTLVNSVSTTGRCTLQPDGNIVFDNVEADGTLTLKFKLDDPVVLPDFGAYAKKQQVRLVAAECAKLYYTIDGSEPDENGTLYTEPFELDTSCTLTVTALDEGAEKSRTSGVFVFPKITGPEFKTVNAGYSFIEPKPIVIENNGIDKLRIVRAELTGNAAKSFILTGESGGRVAPGTTDSKTWTVAPKEGLKAGIYYAAVELSFDSGDTASIPLVFTVR